MQKHVILEDTGTDVAPFKFSALGGGIFALESNYINIGEPYKATAFIEVNSTGDIVDQGVFCEYDFGFAVVSKVIGWLNEQGIAIDNARELVSALFVVLDGLLSGATWPKSHIYRLAEPDLDYIR